MIELRAAHPSARTRKGPAAVLCERCGTDNPEGTIVCVQCYYAVGIPYNVGSGKGGKKSSKEPPAWAVTLGLNDIQTRQICAQLGNLAQESVTGYSFASHDDATETQKALADTIGAEMAAKKVKLATAEVDGRTVLLIAGKVEDPQMLQMVCESFNGQVAF